MVFSSKHIETKATNTRNMTTLRPASRAAEPLLVFLKRVDSLGHSFSRKYSIEQIQKFSVPASREPRAVACPRVPGEPMPSPLSCKARRLQQGQTKITRPRSSGALSLRRAGIMRRMPASTHPRIMRRMRGCGGMSADACRRGEGGANEYRRHCLEA